MGEEPSRCAPLSSGCVGETPGVAPGKQEGTRFRIPHSSHPAKGDLVLAMARSRMARDTRSSSECCWKEVVLASFHAQLTPSLTLCDSGVGGGGQGEMDMDDLVTTEVSGYTTCESHLSPSPSFYVTNSADSCSARCSMPRPSPQAWAQSPPGD